MHQFEVRVHLATVALVSFVGAFVAARAFTTLFPEQVLVGNGIHVHHFWFGIALLAVGGWLGINSRNKDIDIAAAMIYGVGGGLIVDEVGLLLTFGNYWSGLTWVILVILLSVVSVLILLTRYRQQIKEELKESLGSKLAVTLATFLMALSIPFILQTNNLLVVAASVAVSAAAIIVILASIIVQRRKKTTAKM